MWENGFTEIVDSPTRGNAYLVQPEIPFTARIIVQGISDHYGVILEVELEKYCCVLQIERLVPVYHKTDVLGLLQTLHLDKFQNGQAMVVAWRRYGKISRQ